MKVPPNSDSSSDSKLAKTGADTGQTKQLDHEAAQVWSKEGAADWKVPATGNLDVQKLPYELNPPELVDAAAQKWNDWEVKPHDTTHTVQEFKPPHQITDILFPKDAEGKDGGKREIHRDKDGNVDQVNEPDGSRYIKDADGKWHHISKTGQVEDIASVDVKDDGTVNIKRPDGTSRQEYPDGHKVERDFFNRVTEVDYLNKSSDDVPPKGHGDGKRHYHYGPDGKIDEYTAPNGSHWKKDGDHWQKVDEKGNPIVDKNDPENKQNIMYGDMSVDQDGNLTIKNHHMKGEIPHTTTVTGDGRRQEQLEPTAESLGERGERPLVSASDKSPPSDSFMEKVNDEIANLPPNVQKYMRDHHIKVKVMNNIEEGSPEIAEQMARGHHGEKYKNLDGFYDPKTNTVYVSERFRDKNTNQWRSDPIRIGAVIMHETGHAIDYNYPGGKFSQSQAFQEAFKADLLAIKDPIERKRLEYFLQMGAAGGEEAFGDLFAMMYYGRPSFTNSPGLIDLMKAKFAHTLAVIEQGMDKLT